METVEELKRYVRFLYSSLQEKDRENRQVRDGMAEIKTELKAANRRAVFDGTEKSLPEGAPGPVGKSHT